jgi:hypothetical protein
MNSQYPRYIESEWQSEVTIEESSIYGLFMVGYPEAGKG